MSNIDDRPIPPWLPDRLEEVCAEFEKAKRGLSAAALSGDPPRYASAKDEVDYRSSHLVEFYHQRDVIIRCLRKALADGA